MKHSMKRIIAAALSLSLTFGNAALASEALGHDLHFATIPLSEGTELTRGQFWSDTYSDLRTERYVTYTPNEAVTPTVAYGDYVTQRATLSAMARKLEEAGKRVVSGANGDFYVLSSGQPLGLVVTGGILRSSSSYHYAVGFRADGTAFVGQPNVTVTAGMLGERLTVFGGVNKTRQIRTADGGGLTLLSRDFGETTRNTQPGVDVVLRLATEEEMAAFDAAAQEQATLDALAALSAPAVEETSAPEESEAPADGEVPVEGEGPVEAEAPTESESPVEAEAPTESESPAETDAPVESESPVETEAPGESQAPTETDAPPTESELPRMALPAMVGGDAPLSEELKIGSRVRCVVDYVTEAAGANPIPEGGFILTMNAKDDEGTLNMLRALRPGDEVVLDITASEGWEEANEAVGAMYLLLNNGEMGSNLNAEQTARTAVGVKEDGTVVFYTIDGKQSGYSVGASCTQVAKRLKELGCVAAVGLDGGGSTTLGVTSPLDSVMTVINRPTEGVERANSNAIFLTTELAPTGEPGGLLVEQGADILLSGAEMPLSAQLYDTAYYGMGPAGALAFTAEGVGEVTKEGVFTAGKTTGTATITAALEKDRSVTGSSTVTVVDTPHTITVTDEETGGKVTALSLEPGETASLTASATWRTLGVLAQDTCFIWSCDEQVGTIAEDGTFTAGDKTAAGQLTVTAGEKTVTIPVNVAGHILPLADMEGAEPLFPSTSTVTATVETSLEQVKAGKQSLRLDYDTSAEGIARLETALAIPAGERYLGLWLKGDGSGNALVAVTANGGGEETLLPLTTLDFTGWKHILLPLHEDTSALAALEVVYTGVTDGEGTGTGGAIWLDQLTTANEELVDTVPPTVSMEVTEGILTAVISDNVDQSFQAPAVEVRCDGYLVEARWNGEGNVLTATLPQNDGLPHRVTVTAGDVSGNLTRASLNVGEGATGAFADMEGHWASEFAHYLYAHGVTNGVVEGENLNYRPDANITRAEFFTMAARWMRLDLAAYEGVELPFADAADIPAWAVGAVKAMYALGVVKGSQEADGLYAFPHSSINRAEAMTILGRTQARGWPEAELTGFSDGGEVASWAAGYVQSLVGQGVINGYEDGSLRPADPMTRGQVAKVLFTLR